MFTHGLIHSFYINSLKVQSCTQRSKLVPVLNLALAKSGTSLPKIQFQPQAKAWFEKKNINVYEINNMQRFRHCIPFNYVSKPSRFYLQVKITLH